MATKKKATSTKSSKTAPAVKKAKVLSAAEEAVVAANKKAKVAQAEAVKLVKAAKTEAAKVKKEAVAAKVKADAEAATAKVRGKAVAKLAVVAKEVNFRMDKAGKLLKDADDHRLAAALQLAEAEKLSKANKLDYKAWVKENIKLGYESTRKLLPIGRAEVASEGAGALMLSDMRNKNKAAAKKSRDKNKAAAEKPAPVEKRKELEDLTPRERAEEAFEGLGAKSKIAFGNWVAEQIGAKMVMGETADDDLDIPPHLRRDVEDDRLPT